MTVYLLCIVRLLRATKATAQGKTVLYNINPMDDDDLQIKFIKTKNEEIGELPDTKLRELHIKKKQRWKNMSMHDCTRSIYCQSPVLFSPLPFTVKSGPEMDDDLPRLLRERESQRLRDAERLEEAFQDDEKKEEDGNNTTRAARGSRKRKKRGSNTGNETNAHRAKRRSLVLDITCITSIYFVFNDYLKCVYT